MNKINSPDKKRILIIDDNTHIHQDFKKVLLISREKESDLDKLEDTLLGKFSDQQDEIYVIDCASNGKEGLKLVKKSLREKNPYAVAFIDVRMPPGWDGIETISKIWEIYPELHVVICTAYSDYSWEELSNKFNNTDKLLILKKPFDNIEVRQLTYALSKKWELNRIANFKLNELEEEVDKRTEELMHSEEKYRTMIENSNDMIWTLDTKGNFVYFNKKAEELTAYNIKDNIGKTFVPIILEEDREMVQNIFLNTLAGNSNQYEVRIHDSTRKRILTLSVNTTPIFKDGEVTGTVSFGRDITQRKQAENMIKESEEKLRNFIEFTPLGIWCFQAEKPFDIEMPEDQLIPDFFNSICVECNDTYASMIGVSKKEIIGLKLSDVMPDTDENRNYLRAFIQNGFKLSGGISKELTQGGKEKYFSNSLVGVIKNGKLISAWGTQTDVTAQMKTEKALQESEKQLKSLIDAMPDFVCFKDKDGRWIKVNEASLRIFQLEGIDYQGKNDAELAELNHKLRDVLLTCKESDERAWKKSSFTNEEETVPDSGGSLRVFDVTKVPVFSEEGERKGLVVLGHDITERKKADKELRKLSSAVQQSPSVIVITDLDGKLEYVNPKFTELTGYSLQEAIGQNANILKSGDIPDVIYEELWKTITSGNEWHGEFHNTKKNGDLYWESASISPIFDKQGKILNYLKVAEDITKRKQVEDLLRESEERFRDLSEMLPEAIFETDMNNQLIYANRKAFELFGYSAGSIKTGLNGYDMIVPGDREKAEQNFKRRLIGEKIGPMEYTGLKKDGSTFPMLFNTNTIQREGKPTGFRGIIIDITERKQKEKDLLIALEKAEESDRLKKAFLSNMSHEIRTPLNGMLGFINLLSDFEISNTERKQYISIIHKSSDRLLNTINDLIDISRIESGQIKVTNTATSINKLLDELHDFFNTEAKLKGLSLTFLPALSDNRDTVYTDSDKLYGILTNLIKNAIKYTEEGNIEFGYYEKPDSKPAELEFYVKDTGIGVPKDRQEAIFDRFMQADIENTRAYEGSGLGLSIAKAYVEMMGGKIWMESEESKGSVFYFTIPYDTKKRDSLDIQEPSSPKKSKKQSLEYLTILIAEDEELSLLYLTELLKNRCKRLIQTRDGEETVKIVRENRDIDVILMDIKMPKMDGYEATRKIREFNKDIRIIAQTACAFTNDREKSLEAGCDEFITKPVNKNNLFKLIIEVAHKKKSN